MKVFIICLLLFVLELVTAAPSWVPHTKPRRVPLKFPLHTGTPGPRILGGELQSDKTAINQVLPLLTPALSPIALNLAPALGKPLLDLGASLGKKAVKRVVCDSTAWLQEYAGSEEKDAKIMALVKVMSDMLTAQEKLSEAKKLNMEDNLVVKAELFDLVSDALEGALDIIGDTAKEVLCSE